MKFVRYFLCLSAFGLVTSQCHSADVQEFVFLGEAKPILVRLHIEVDGKPLDDVWNAFVAEVFGSVDEDDDGVLSKSEGERVPHPASILAGGFPAIQAANWKDLDGDGDGKVTKEELAKLYRSGGLAPFQLQLNAKQAQGMNQVAAMYSGKRPDPPVEAVGKASYRLLDADGNGLLSREELLAAPSKALALDENEDEMIDVQEIADDAIPKLNLNELGGMMRGGTATNPAEGSDTLVPIVEPGKTPKTLVEKMLKRYGKTDGVKKLGRKELGIAKKTFAKLDTDKDKSLREDELAAFVKRSPDVEVVVRLGETDDEALVVKRGKATLKVGQALLDFGRTRLVLQSEAESSDTRFDGFIQQQIVAQLKSADANSDGFIDEKEIEKNPLWQNGLLKRVDRDGDKKASMKELADYLTEAAKLAAKASRCCVKLSLGNESRGLFTLFDANADLRLSVRELRQGPKLLERFAQKDASHLSKTDIPSLYRITLALGPVSLGAGNQRAILALYSGGYEKKYTTTTSGPRWFQKMDRNRDGDVSRKEFLFDEAAFQKLDTDGDGLIGVDEATAATE